MNTLEAPARSITPAAPDLEREPSAEQLRPRVNLQINLANWKDLDPEIVTELTWFHQHLLDTNMSNDDASKALSYEWTVVFRAIKGTYEGSYANIAKSIVRYRKELRDRLKIQNVEFVHTHNTRMIFEALDYSVASKTITLILGESGMSKTMSLRHWRDLNNSGRTILVTTPALCTTKNVLTEVCHSIGAKPTTSIGMVEKIKRALNRGRTIIFDEAHFLLPSNSYSTPTTLEVLRQFHDLTECSLAFVATARFGEDLTRSEYQFEQLLGRIGLPVRLERNLKLNDVRPLIEQYFVIPTDYLVEQALAITNNEMPEIRGRIRALVEILRLASRISAKERGPRKMSEQHFKNALALRKKMMGEFQYAKH